MWKLFVVTLALCCLTSLECLEKKKKLKWWQTDVIYQIYPRSFKDSNADGVGDLLGVYHKLEYFKEIGVGCIWFSPILKSPMADFGYDVENFKAIDPIFGNMDHFDKLLKKAHKLGIKVIMDFVPNHSSNKHEWFEKSAKKIEPYTNFYIWKDAKYEKGQKQVPNNWLTNFGKTAWTWNEERGQYYFHQFTLEQPELDMRNPVVQEELKSIIEFWLDKGIDGLRIDSVNFFIEDERFLDEPRSNDPDAQPEDYPYLDHIYSVNQEESIKVVQRWRKIFDKYSQKGRERAMLTEAYANVSYVLKFYGTEKEPGANLPFNFLLITDVTKDSNAYHIRDTINSWLDNAPKDTWPNWVIGNHDNPRPATRFNPILMDGLYMLQLLLPGTAIVYYGDELGMEDTWTRWDETVDERAFIAGKKRYHEYSRDPCRTPMQWDDTRNAGFTKSLTTWLPVNPTYYELNVQNQLRATESGKLTHLQIFKELTSLRNHIVFQQGDLNIYVLSDWVLAFTRSYADHPSFTVILNLGSEVAVSDLLKHRPTLPDFMTVVVPSINSGFKKGESVFTSAIVLRPKAALVLSPIDKELTDETKTEVKKDAPAATNPK